MCKVEPCPYTIPLLLFLHPLPLFIVLCLALLISVTVLKETSDVTIPPCQPNTGQLPWIRLGGQQLLSTSYRRRKSRHLVLCVVDVWETCLCMWTGVHVHRGCHIYRNRGQKWQTGAIKEEEDPTTLWIWVCIYTFHCMCTVCGCS